MSDVNALPEFDNPNHELHTLAVRDAFIAIGFVEQQRGLFSRVLPYSVSPYLRAVMLLLNTKHPTDFHAVPRDLASCRIVWKRK